MNANKQTLLSNVKTIASLLTRIPQDCESCGAQLITKLRVLIASFIGKHISFYF